MDRREIISPVYPFNRISGNVVPNNKFIKGRTIYIQKILNGKVMKIMTELNINSSNTSEPMIPIKNTEVISEDVELNIDKRILAMGALVGSYSYEAILASIEEQFQDYIELNDPTNYVEIFYDQLGASYVKEDDTMEHPIDTEELLNYLLNEFNDFIMKLFKTKLNIAIPGIEENHIDEEKLKYVIIRTYEFFILKAKRNFKVAISAKTNSILLANGLPSDYFKQVQMTIDIYTPIIQTITPEEFLRLAGDPDMMQIWNDDLVVGNFLMMYTPAFNKNESFADEVINYITSQGKLSMKFQEELNSKK